MVEHLLYTMEEVGAWTEEQVVDWLRAVSAGSPILQREYTRNEGLFRKLDGSELLKLDDYRLQCMEIRPNSRFVLVPCLTDLQGGG